MKSANRFTLGVTLCVWAASAGAQSFVSGVMGSGDSRATLTVKPDGSCLLSSESVQPRKSLERQVRSWERNSKMAEGPEEEDAPATQPVKLDQKQLSDDDLAKKIREMYATRLDFGEESGQKIETLEVTTNSVRMVTSRTLGSLKELLGESLWSWGPSFLTPENARFETDTNGLLRITFKPFKESERYSKNMARQWKSTKTKLEWKLVLPGKVVSSGLPETQDNTTGVTLDSSKPESVDAVLKLMGIPIVITAEARGIKLDEALESQKLVRAARRGSLAQPDLPITDAGPGFVAEPVGITVTTIHYFPDGEKYFKEQPSYSYGMQSTGTVVTAKLFPPKGRTIRSVSGLRVLKAKDDKGRAIAGTVGEDAENEATYSETEFSFGSSDKSGAARLELRLGLPAGDAQTIEELEAEGIVLSIGGWKEMVLTNVQADSQKGIDLSEILPEAKLIITKVTAKRSQTTVQARLEGPPTVDQLDAKLKVTEGRGSTHMSQRQSRTSGGKSVRSITVQGFDFEMAGGSAPHPTTLIVRIPQDSKRERVRFKLTALDLL